MSAELIDAGTFAVQYDEDRKQYLVRETIEGRERWCDDLHEVLQFVGQNVWEPEDQS